MITGWLLVLLLLAFVSCSHCSANQGQVLTSYKQIPIEQWEQLKQNNHQLELKLTEAQLQAEMLLKQSSVLKAKLVEAEKQLTISTQELQSSKISLENAKELQEKARVSLTELSNQIDEERKKQESIKQRLRLQRTFAYILLGLAVIHK